MALGKHGVPEFVPQRLTQFWILSLRIPGPLMINDTLAKSWRASGVFLFCFECRSRVQENTPGARSHPKSYNQM